MKAPNIKQAIAEAKEQYRDVLITKAEYLSQIARANALNKEFKRRNSPGDNTQREQ